MADGEIKADLYELVKLHSFGLGSMKLQFGMVPKETKPLRLCQIDERKCSTVGGRFYGFGKTKPWLVGKAGDPLEEERAACVVDNEPERQTFIVGTLNRLRLCARSASKTSTSNVSETINVGVAPKQPFPIGDFELENEELRLSQSERSASLAALRVNWTERYFEASLRLNLRQDVNTTRRFEVLRWQTILVVLLLPYLRFLHPWRFVRDGKTSKQSSSQLDCEEGSSPAMFNVCFESMDGHVRRNPPLPRTMVRPSAVTLLDCTSGFAPSLRRLVHVHNGFLHLHPRRGEGRPKREPSSPDVLCALIGLSFLILILIPPLALRVASTAFMAVAVATEVNEGGRIRVRMDLHGLLDDSAPTESAPAKTAPCFRLRALIQGVLQRSTIGWRLEGRALKSAGSLKDNNEQKVSLGAVRIGRSFDSLWMYVLQMSLSLSVMPPVAERMLGSMVVRLWCLKPRRLVVMDVSRRNGLLGWKELCSFR
ncbi:hypothetical protein IWX90DRAFT_411528 [Phyllosticta citrichinensis]|uniref:Uncharacterized protein n=1 Tax=Phyllosticta citrichinensis TaxID=1130410 RepID=A0ABR1YA57_9PEZI